MNDKYWDDVHDTDVLQAVRYTIPVYRMVMIAGAVRDFNSLHHNPEVARERGAPDIFVNNTALLAMWERAVREYIGLRGAIRAVKGFRMGSFNVTGETLVVTGDVIRKWKENDGDREGFVEIEVKTESSKGVTVGPGTVVAALPCRN